MQLSGKMNLFVNEHQDRNGETFNTYSTTESMKNKDESYSRVNVTVTFANKEKFTPEVLKKLDDEHWYEVEVLDGFTSVEEFATKKYGLVRRIKYVVRDATIKKANKLEPKKTAPVKSNVEAPKDDDLPF